MIDVNLNILDEMTKISRPIIEAESSRFSPTHRKAISIHCT